MKRNKRTKLNKLIICGSLIRCLFDNWNRDSGWGNGRGKNASLLKNSQVTMLKVYLLHGANMFPQKNIFSYLFY
jgi:hypothetical protein